MYYGGTLSNSADVTWVEPNGSEKQVSVNLAGIYDSKKSGTLVFGIEGEKVHASFRELK